MAKTKVAMSHVKDTWLGNNGLVVKIDFYQVLLQVFLFPRATEFILLITDH